MITMMLAPVLCLAALGTADRGVFLPLDGKPKWGFRNGIQVALYPQAIGDAPGDGGPRGLLRIGYPILPDGGEGLINFIVVEPLVGGRKGLSELERSADGRPGKVFTAADARLEKQAGRETLRVKVNVERFDNGAHVYLWLVFRSDRPDEVEMQAVAEPDSAPIEECPLSATMGNYERLRQVWLRAGPVDSKNLYGDYRGDGFAADHNYPVAELATRPDGVIVPCTPDEREPRDSQSRLPDGIFWRYPGVRVTQYWRAPAGSYSPNLRLRVNGRRVYWGSHIPLPGGIAFENIELRDGFRSGQPFVFGVTQVDAAGLLGEDSKGSLDH